MSAARAASRWGALASVLLILLFSGGAWSQTPEAPEEESTDQRLTRQLRRAFAQVQGLDGVTLEVRGGVVVLRGRVPGNEARAKAAELASRLDGVLTVDNGIEVHTEVTQRLSPVFERLQDKAGNFLAFLPVLIVAILLFWCFWLVAGLLGRSQTIYRRLSDNLFVQDLLSQGVRFVVILVGLLIALEILEATALVGAVLGTAGVVGIALGFAFRDSAENSLASVMLSLRQPFAPKDHVRIDGHEGIVVRLTSRSTILLTLEGNHLRLPNALVFKAVILNFTRNPRRRFTFTLGVDPSSDLLEAQRLILAVLQDMPGVLHDPPPSCHLEALGDWAAEVVVFGWVDQTQHAFAKTRGEALRLTKETLEEQGIALPGPQATVFLQREAPDPPSAPVASECVSLEDLAPETHLEELAEQERLEAGEGEDLLDRSAPIE